MNVFGLLFLAAIVCVTAWRAWEPLRRAIGFGRWDVFVSYRSLDRDIVALLVSAMKRRGFKVWFDRTEITEVMSRKGRFARPISRGLQQSVMAVVFTSPKYWASQYCREEAQFLVARLALDGPGRIIEVRLDGHQARDILRIPRESPLIDATGCSADNPGRLESLGEEIILEIEKGLRRLANNKRLTNRVVVI